MRKDYIGDGVYVEPWELGGVRLTTEDGFRITNVIILQPEVFNSLLLYLKQMKESGAGGSGMTIGY